MIFYVLVGVLTLAFITACFICYRLSKKLLQFDELFELLRDDIETNVKFFEKLLQMPLFFNSPEIEEANKNMRIMQIRLEEFTTRMAEVRGKELPEPAAEEPPKKNLPRPVAR